MTLIHLFKKPVLPHKKQKRQLGMDTIVSDYQVEKNKKTGNWHIIKMTKESIVAFDNHEKAQTFMGALKDGQDILNESKSKNVT